MSGIAVIVMMVGILLYVSGKAIKANQKRRGKVSKIGLSWPAKQVIQKYNELPMDNRPYPDIRSLVEALDVKHGKDTMDDHVSSRYDAGKAWGYCRAYRCSKCSKYKEVCDKIENLTKSLRKQQQVLEIAERQGDLDELPRLLDALGEESKIVNQVTDAIKRGMN